MTALTVVMPTYERAELIGEALGSALAQTYGDIVVLIGDNSESDATEEVVAAVDDPRVHYHRNRPGLGSLGNWLDLLDRVETPLVATLHDDDRWHPDFLATTVPPMLADETIAMAFTDFWQIDQHGNRLVEYTEAETARTHRDVLPAGRLDYDLAEGLRLVAVWNAPQPAYAAVLRRDALAACDYSDGVELYDIWTSYQLIKRGAGLYYVPERLTEYRVHPGAATSQGFAEMEDRVFRHILDDSADAGPVLDEIARYWAGLRWARATRLMGSGAEGRVASQRELLAAAPRLGGPKRLVATAAGRSSLVWDGMRMAHSARHRTPKVGDVRYAT
ncbi:MAG: glycosyltransferase family 2 protein [Acidimicrobiales bacterium]